MTKALPQEPRPSSQPGHPELPRRTLDILILCESSVGHPHPTPPGPALMNSPGSQMQGIDIGWSGGRELTLGIPNKKHVPKV